MGRLSDAITLDECQHIAKKRQMNGDSCRTYFFIEDTPAYWDDPFLGIFYVESTKCFMSQYDPLMEVRLT